MQNEEFRMKNGENGKNRGRIPKTTTHSSILNSEFFILHSPKPSPMYRFRNDLHDSESHRSTLTFPHEKGVRMRRFVIAVLSLLALSASAQQLPPKISEKVNVNLVLLDAVVTDSRGHQILGLDKDDFVVTENGAPQAIESVDYFTNRQLLTSPESKASFKAERVRDDRYFVFFFDKPSESQFFGRLAVARRAAAD